MTKRLEQLFFKHFGEAVERVEPLPEHASQRKLFRLFGQHNSCIGVSFADLNENLAFIGFSETFRSLGLPVPEIYCISEDQLEYLEQDLGDMTLYSFLQSERKHGHEFSDEIENYYREALSWLVKFQARGANAIDYKLCYQGQVFDQAAMLRDFQAYAKDFLEVAGLTYDKNLFDGQVKQFTGYLASAEASYFLYRDFQARNIMITPNGLYFIDYQTGRRGPLQCDVVALLYQAQARIPENSKLKLLAFYLTELEAETGRQPAEFMQYYYGFVVLRLVQVLATYGREGLKNQKEYFLKGIPFALGALAEVAEAHGPLQDFSELRRLALIRNL